MDTLQKTLINRIPKLAEVLCEKASVPEAKLLFAQLIMHEGVRSVPYKDTKGKWTCGVGHLLPKNVAEEYAKLDKNDLANKAWDVETICSVFVGDVYEAVGDVLAIYGDYASETGTPARLHSLIDMAFNMGRSSLMGFKDMRGAIKLGDWNKAADEALDSKWKREDVSESRSTHVANQLRTGEFEVLEYV